MYDAKIDSLLKQYGIDIIDMEKLNDNLDLAVKGILTETCAGKECALWGAGRMNTTSSHAANYNQRWTVETSIDGLKSGFAFSENTQINYKCNELYLLIK